ncbi:1483_t:CDS:1, partial [Acaulospora colombiana]
GLPGTQFMTTQPNIPMGFPQPQQQTNFSARGPIFPSTNPIGHSDNPLFAQNSQFPPQNTLTKSDNAQSYSTIQPQVPSNQALSLLLGSSSDALTCHSNIQSTSLLKRFAREGKNSSLPNSKHTETPPTTPLQEQRTSKSSSKALSGLSNMWLYVASLRSFDEAIKKSKIEEAIEFLGKILNTYME